MKQAVLSALLALSLFFVGCGASTPSQQQARKVFDNSFKNLNDLGIKVIDFRKVNAEVHDVEGQKIYIYHYLGIAKLPDGLAWAAPGFMGSGGFVKDPGNGRAVTFGGGNTQRLKEGTIALRRGTITCRMTENGWVSQDIVDTANDAQCANVAAEECIKQLGFDKIE